MGKEMWGGGIFADNLYKAIDKFVRDKNLTNESRRNLEDDIILSYIMFGSTPQEYFLLGFSNLSKRDKATYVTDKIKDIECMRTLPLEEFNRQLTNKYNFYCHNREFFRREAILISKDNQQADIIDFVKKHRKVFVKPNGGSYGHGAFVCEYDGNDDGLASKISEIESQGDWVAEELVKQSENMGKWNQSSVNTVRIPSFFAGGEYHILAPFMRTGRQDSIVDNGGSGGIFAAIDPNNGMIISDGCDESGNRYESHPDSNISFYGWTIPEWKELKDLAMKVHRNMPGHKYIAFDFALTPDGWVLIEGNWGQFLWQYATKIGIKDEFLKLMHS